MCGFGAWLRQDEAALLRVIIEYLGVASPVHRSFELALDFVLAEVFVENVVKEFIRDGMIGLRPENALDALQDGHMFERGFAKKYFAGEECRLRRRLSLQE